MNQASKYGLREFLLKYSGMALRPRPGDASIRLTGAFEFTATYAGYPEITDSYSLRIAVPAGFPRELPRVEELDGRISRDGTMHVNPDGALCLGSPLRLLLTVSREPTLVGFADNCVVPFLYAMSHRRKCGGPLPFNELQHGPPGAHRDHADLLGLGDSQKAKAALHLLTMKKHGANKEPCPCGCGRRAGKCTFNGKLRSFREIGTRSCYRAIEQQLNGR